MRVWEYLTALIPGSTKIANTSATYNVDQILEAVNSKDANRENFWNVLCFAIPKSLYKPPQNRQIKILNLACGACIEGDVLNSYFGNKNFGELSDNVILTGVDIDKQDELARPYPFGFVCDDLTKPVHPESIPTDVDIVIIRHQQLLSVNAPWEKIFKQAIDRISKNGIILVTSYGEVEHTMMVDIMKKLGAKIILNETNPNAKSMGFPSVFMDGKVAVIKKGTCQC